MSNKLNKTISEIWNDDYVVPLYQRNFAWDEQQIQQLLQDIYDNSKNPGSRYYIGSLVVLQRPTGIYEVIDGQQRLTTLHLICKSLGILNAPHLTYDSRPEVEEFFDGLFKSASSREYSAYCKTKDNTKIFRLVDAVDIVETTTIHTNPGSKDDKLISLSSKDFERDRFKQYLSNNVVLVRTELPSDTDVAAYFEIMNNRGEQLQEHEIIKALMMKKLKEEERSFFSSVWDACSQMNVPIQRGLSVYMKDKESLLFGEDYGSLNLEHIDAYFKDDNTDSFLSIDEILESPNNEHKDNTTGEYNVTYEAIIDFPNFLMHVLKLFDDSCQLNADYLYSTYSNMGDKIDSMKFIKTLLKIRTLFDRYIIKLQAEDDEDEHLKWIMKKPYLYKTKDRNLLRFRNTFSNKTDEADENEEPDYISRKIIMQESMLQVTIRNKKYKSWLFDLLKWIKDKDVENVDCKELTSFLDNWILNYYHTRENQQEKAPNTSWAFEALGTDTPHFVFNFIDYLYWVAAKREISDIRYLNEVDDFYFKYYNSVEHHLPQSYKDVDDVNVDNIGNLCLISRRKNSSLNDKAPKEKAKIEEGLQPKRKIMYRITQDSQGLWGKKQIEYHYIDIFNLLDKAETILTN